MAVTYSTSVIFEGNHASLHIPELVLKKLEAGRRAPLKVTVNGHSYQSTSTTVNGKCRVVFPTRDRKKAGITVASPVEVTLVVEPGYREVPLPDALAHALEEYGLTDVFRGLAYSKRRLFALQISDAKSAKTVQSRLEKICSAIRGELGA
jgi:bifunctional DNA-binding transcriptional regulator/antitoxin component of YhaV-PrlF toxin-antitoxin module